MKYFALFVILIVSVQGKNILAVFPSISKSHYLFGISIVFELAQCGHNITVISAFSSVPRVNVTEINVEEIEKIYLENGLSFDYETRKMSILETFSKTIYATTSTVDVILKNVHVQALLRSENHFDLVIIDAFLSDALLGFGIHYKAPTIVLGLTDTNKWINTVAGNSFNHYNSYGFSESTNLVERVTNTLKTIFGKLTYSCLYLPYQEYLFKQHFGLQYDKMDNMPQLHNLIHDVRMFLINSHPLVQQQSTHALNEVNIGGAHLKRNSSTLAKVFKNFMDEAPEGVIYISFGSNLRTADLPKAKIDALIGAFRVLQGRMRVLLKWEDFELKPQPRNTVIGKWLPQQEILAHQNLKVFISSVGLMSTMEAIQAGVPVIGIPVFEEQMFYMKRLESLGSGIRLSYENISTESLVWAINEIVLNQKYKDNAINASSLFNDHLISPMAKAMYNIELVFRTEGVPHLQSFATKLGFIQRYLIDVWVVIIIVSVSIIVISLFIIRAILKKVYFDNYSKKTKKLNLSKSKKIN